MFQLGGLLPQLTPGTAGHIDWSMCVKVSCSRKPPTGHGYVTGWASNLRDLYIIVTHGILMFREMLFSAQSSLKRSQTFCCNSRNLELIKIIILFYLSVCSFQTYMQGWIVLRGGRGHTGRSHSTVCFLHFLGGRGGWVACPTPIPENFENLTF